MRKVATPGTVFEGHAEKFYSVGKLHSDDEGQEFFCVDTVAIPLDEITKEGIVALGALGPNEFTIQKLGDGVKFVVAWWD